MYGVGDKVLYRLRTENKHVYEGPLEITKIHNNGTVTLDRKDRVTEKCTILLLQPYLCYFMNHRGGSAVLKQANCDSSLRLLVYSYT